MNLAAIPMLITSVLILLLPFILLFFASSKSMENPKSGAKYAFFYVLSLVALIFTALPIGMIIFQIINKVFPDPIGTYEGVYSSGVLRFAISALIIAAPIFFLTMRYIYNSLYKGTLEKNSRERVWLTYVILFISSVIMIGWLIATLNSFLNGEITSKFILKAIASLAIAGSIFTFYFYDIRREEIQEKEDKVILGYAYGSMAIVIIALIAGFYFNDSPAKVRAMNHDRLVIQNFDQIDNAVNSYFNKNKSVPVNLEELVKADGRDYFVSSDTIKEPETKKFYDYKKLAADSYEICADFKASNKEALNADYDKFLNDRWQHEAGYQCFTKKAELYRGIDAAPIKD